MKTQTAIRYVLLLFLFSLLASCGGNAPKTVSALNSHVLHTQNGFMLLERKHYELAQKEFDKALSYNGKYSLAYMGRAEVYLHQKMLNEAHEELQKALKFAKTDDDVLKVKSGLIQFYSSPEFVGRHHGKNAWLILSKQEFDDAEKIRRSEEVYYYMAIAYAYDFQFGEARRLLDEIMRTENPFTLRASEEKMRLKTVEGLVGSYPKAKSIVFEEHLTRGELSFALVELFEMDKKISHETGSVKLVARDSLSSPYTQSITKVINLDLNSLGILSDKTFRPNKPLSRAELASLLKELYERLGKKEVVAKGKNFSDVTTDDWFYESVQFVSAQNLMTEEDKLTMEFRPLEDVSAVEALEVINKLLGGK